MLPPLPSGEKPELYDIRVLEEIPAAVLDRLPVSSVHRVPMETILYRDVTDPDELDSLLEKLQSVGLVVSELHESCCSASAVIIPFPSRR